MAHYTARVETQAKPERPLRKDAERNRQRVIAAARDLFATRGLDATLNEVAHHGGVAVGTVYNRFPTREALYEAIFEDSIDEMATWAESALQYEHSGHGFTWFVERICELTATDRGLREILFGKVEAGHRVDAARERLVPKMTKVVERAQNDGYLRPEVSVTDVPIISLLAGKVSEFAGHVDASLWRRYVAIILDGVRDSGQGQRLPVDALLDDQMELVVSTWQPTGPDRGKSNLA